jgi:integrase
MSFSAIGSSPTSTRLLKEFASKLQSGELQKTVYTKTKCTDKREIRGASNATINRILALLRRMVNIAWEDGLIHAVPKFPMRTEDNVRTGFLEVAQFKVLLSHLPSRLHTLMIFLFTTGCRIGAASLITWDMVSPDGRGIDLPGSIVKNKTNITLPLTAELTALLKKQFRQNGQPVFDCTNLRRAWDEATVAAGFPDLIMHDLRRSGVRQLIKAGVPEKVAMQISGHKTRSVFDRYNIVSTDQVEDAMQRVQRNSGNLMGASNV